MKAIFLDRDGVINHDCGYAYLVEDLRIIPGVPRALRLLQQMGYVPVIVTNQSAIGRGFCNDDDVDKFMDALYLELQNQGTTIPKLYDYCPHRPIACCWCRKPEPGMLLEVARHHGIDLAQSFMVGDKHSDVQAGDSAGCRYSFQVETNKPGELLRVVHLIREHYT